MKYLNWCIGILTLALGLASCNSETEETTTTVPSTIQVATGDLQDVTLTTATLLGAVTVSGANLVEVGFACCLENSSHRSWQRLCPPQFLGDCPRLATQCHL